MSIYHLEKIFEPASVAVIGASETEGSIGWTIMQNLTGGGYQGKIFPVNPKYETLFGMEAFPSLSDTGQAVEMAVIATPISTVPGIVRECADLGVGGAVIISAGGRETGEQGLELEKEIEKEAQKGGVRIVGPNCMGIICPAQSLNASFAAHMPAPGNTAFISQSGAICSAVLDLSLKENMGFRYFVSIGSMLDVDFGDLIDYIGNDSAVTSILLYVESLTEIRKFMSAARAVSAAKPIVVLKAGKSRAGARAAASHTGALAGEDQVYDAAFKRAGIARVGNLEDFFDCAEMLAKQPLPGGPRLVVVTNSGGPGVMAADAVSEQGLTLSPLEENTREKLDKILPPHWSRGNPIDMLGDATPERYARVTDLCCDVREFDGMLVIVNPQAMTDPTGVAKVLARHLEQKSFPVFGVFMGGKDVEPGREILNSAGIPTYDTPERAVRSFAVLTAYARNLELLQEIPSAFLHDIETEEDHARDLVQAALERPGRFMGEMESKSLLAAYGIPVNPTKPAASAQEAVDTASDMGFPLVMKVLSPDISHKTDAGGVMTDLYTEEDIRKAYDTVMERSHAYDPEADIQGVSLQPMIKGKAPELLIGAKQDPGFGPVILFGMGGIFAEVLKDRNIALPPLNRALARRVMEGTRVYQLLQGYRNIPRADLERLEQVLVCLSHLLVDFPEIRELDMNPVMIRDGRPVAVDARVMVKPADKTSPRHLVISSYPEQYESTEKTGGGLDVLIRPVKPEDAPLLEEFFDTLSQESRYNRFFAPKNTLSHDMLIRLTQIDYDRHIALTAVENAREERILGTARIIMGPDETSGEFSIVVGDAWQGQGLGRILLEKCLDAAGDYGVTTVYGTVLKQNRNMLALARELGFKVTGTEDSGLFELSIDLDK